MGAVMGITDTQSYSYVIHKMFYDAVMTLPYFASFVTRSNQAFQVQMKLPFVGVYEGVETIIPDGDPNCGQWDFIHDQRICFSIVVRNNDPVVAQAKLDEAWLVIMKRIYEDPYLLNKIDTVDPHTGIGNPDNVRIEGILRADKRYRWGNSTLTNETPFAELAYDITVRHRLYWTPQPFDDLNIIHVETVPLASDGTVPPAEEVERVQTEYDLTAEPYPDPNVDPPRRSSTDPSTP